MFGGVWESSVAVDCPSIQLWVCHFAFLHHLRLRHHQQELHTASARNTNLQLILVKFVSCMLIALDNCSGN